MTARSDEELFRAMDDAHVRAGAAQLDQLRLIAEAEGRSAWAEHGARDMAQFLSIRYGLSDWKARRWIAAALALESLPRVAEALGSEALRIDKVVELTRYATAETEASLVQWAQRVPPARIRQEADRAVRRDREDAERVESERSLDWWPSEEGRMLDYGGRVPMAEGMVFVSEVERMMERLPRPGPDEAADPLGAWRADALMALVSARAGDEPDSEPTTLVVHVPIDALARGEGSMIEGGGVVGPEVLGRLLCDSRVQTVLEEGGGNPVRTGRMARSPSRAMIRQLRYRDVGCVFPGCGTRMHVKAHHVAWWSAGGTTDLDNLVLLCRFHHVLVHELGWSLKRMANGTIRWYRPDGRRFRAGPAPPAGPGERITSVA